MSTEYLVAMALMFSPGLTYGHVTHPLHLFIPGSGMNRWNFGSNKVLSDIPWSFVCNQERLIKDFFEMRVLDHCPVVFVDNLGDTGQPWIISNKKTVLSLVAGFFTLFRASFLGMRRALSMAASMILLE